MRVDEAVFELKQIRDVYANMRKEYKSCVEALDMAIKALETQKWIPCSEGLPGSEEYVWAVYKNSLFPNGKSHHKTLKYDGEKWIDENGYRYLTANVTHWKYRDPLPGPYKEEE